MPYTRPVRTIKARIALGAATFCVAVSAACGTHAASVVPEVRPQNVDLGSAALRTNDSLEAPAKRIYVANRSSNAITEYPLSANGNARPSARISGSNTQLSAPQSLGLDSGKKLYVLSVSSIAVFVANARGNVKPKLAISGGLTQLSSPQGIAVDPTGKTYVTNQGGGGFGYITAYAAGANGDRAPVQVIMDGASQLFIPTGIALHGKLLYVADIGDSSINEYSSSANGTVNPVNVILGLSSPSGIAVDANGLIYVTDGDSVIVYAANAKGHDPPLRTISGTSTHLHSPNGLAALGSIIVVANAGSNSITVYPVAGNGNIPPLREIAGTHTELNSPQDVGVR
jgi:hypothetical protein